MCIYITDDGEQCSRDSEPFCFQHEDSQQADIYHIVLEGTESGSDGGVELHDPYHCDDCEMPVRQTVGEIEQSVYSPEMVNVEEVLMCGCASTTIRTYRKERSAIPSGWLDDE